VLYGVGLENIVDNSWNFNGANTKEYTHCYHNYPAMMIPQIARRLVLEYKQKSTHNLLDPYCGSGTSLVESLLQEINATGFDINPLAVFISSSKTTLFSIELIKQEIVKLTYLFDEYKSSNNNQHHLFNQSGNGNIIGHNNFPLNNFKNIDFWYKPEKISELSFIKNLITEIIKPEVQLFFLTAFSETSREVSLTRNSEFKLFRIKSEKIDDYNPDTFGIFLQKIFRNLSGLKDFVENSNSNFKANVIQFNSSLNNPEDIVDRQYDLVVTSPPYGDSRTTVAYGQFSRLSSQWLGFLDAEKVDKSLMGGKIHLNLNGFELSSCKSEFQQIKDIDQIRYSEVISFTYDYYNSIKNINSIINKGAYICYVLGNRTVKGIQIPLDKITVECFEIFGYKHINTIIRKIPNKRMPSKNSPSNEKGVIGNTMTNEFIVIMKKQ
jgi:DNA modification methylase